MEDMLLAKVKAILTGNALKLYCHIYLESIGQHGVIDVRYPALGVAVGRSKGSLEKDISELEAAGVCRVEATANQHKLARIELLGPFRPADSDISVQPDLGIGTSVGDNGGSAFTHLVDFGIAPPVAKELVGYVSDAAIVDTIEYVTYLSSQPRSHIRHPQSLLVHYLRNDIRVPSGFLTNRQRNEQEKENRMAEQARQRVAELEISYTEFCDHVIEQQIAERYSGDSLNVKLETIRKALIKDPKVARIRSEILQDIARRQLAKEMRSDVSLPTFEDWCKDRGDSKVDLR